MKKSQICKMGYAVNRVNYKNQDEIRNRWVCSYFGLEKITQFHNNIDDRDTVAMFKKFEDTDDVVDSAIWNITRDRWVFPWRVEREPHKELIEKVKNSIPEPDDVENEYDCKNCIHYYKHKLTGSCRGKSYELNQSNKMDY